MGHAKLLLGGVFAVVAVMVVSAAIVVMAPYIAILLVLGVILKITLSTAEKEEDPKE